ncbi:hypothetical protein DFH27DRAFT_583451 [Peziza echinospora]|nr:hypothetical protein DFH27DRAFT_583451 [Peziza echinospora]
MRVIKSSRWAWSSMATVFVSGAGSRKRFCERMSPTSSPTVVTKSCSAGSVSRWLSQAVTAAHSRTRPGSTSCSAISLVQSAVSARHWASCLSTNRPKHCWKYSRGTRVRFCLLTPRAVL